MNSDCVNDLGYVSTDVARKAFIYDLGRTRVIPA